MRFQAVAFAKDSAIETTCICKHLRFRSVFSWTEHETGAKSREMFAVSNKVAFMWTGQEIWTFCFDYKCLKRWPSYIRIEDQFFHVTYTSLIVVHIPSNKDS